MTRSSGDAPKGRRGPAFWGALYFVAMAAVGAARITDAIGATTGLLLMLVVSAVLVPQMARSAILLARRTGGVSAAAERYNRRFLIATLAYVLGLGIATWVHEQAVVGQAVSALLAMLPAVPTVAMVWTMARYLAEEDDEYLRHRAVQAALAGLGVVLALGSFWGFLETFGVVPHIWAWWVVPVWAVGMGAWHVWAHVRGQAA